MARQLATSVTSLSSCKPICWRRRAAIQKCSARCTTSRAAGACALATSAIAAQEISDAPKSDVASSLLAQAVAYEHGEGVPKDPIRAAALYCAAARSGDAEAQFSLGWMYANGRGIARDDAVAGSLFVLAA